MQGVVQVALKVKERLRQKRIWVPVLILSLCGLYFVAFQTIDYPPLGLYDGCFDCFKLQLSDAYHSIRESASEKGQNRRSVNLGQSSDGETDAEPADFDYWTMLLAIYVLLLVMAGVFVLVTARRRGGHRHHRHSRHSV